MKIWSCALFDTYHLRRLSQLNPAFNSSDIVDFLQQIADASNNRQNHKRNTTVIRLFRYC